MKKIDMIDKDVNLLIIGGSQGAKVFDTIVQSSIIDLSKKYKFKVYQQANKKNFQSLKLFYQDNKIMHELFE